MDRQTARLILQQGKISLYTQTLNARNDACYYLRSQQVSISMKDPLNGDNLDARKGQRSSQTEPT